jgi:hypothetical protein
MLLLAFRAQLRLSSAIESPRPKAAIAVLNGGVQSGAEGAVFTQE